MVGDRPPIGVRNHERPVRGDCRVDGPNGCGRHGRIANAPIEALETDDDHFRLEEYALVDGSGGAGAWRGGMGFRRVYAATRDNVQFSGYADRHAYTATGLFGGGPGAPGRFRVIRTDGTEEILPTLTSVQLNQGDLIEVVTGGGGG